MNDHESMFDDRSRWGSFEASLDEMPPQDFETDHSDGEEFSIRGFLVCAAIFAAVVLPVFKFL